MNSGIFKWSHIFQVPIVLLINGFLAFHYYRRGESKTEGTYRFGPLYLHLLGTVLVLVQPVLDPHGGSILYDIQHGFNHHGTIEPPHFFAGGFWHHGALMAFFQVSGLVCIATASLWSSGVFQKTQRLLEERDQMDGYGLEEKQA